MTPALWQQVSTLFSDCLQRSSIARELLLASLETSQPDVVREVRELLATYEKDREFLESPAEQRLTEASFAAAAELRARPPAPRRTFWSSLKRKPATFWFLAAAELVAFIFYVGVIVLVSRYGGLDTRLGWNCELAGNQWKVDTVDKPGPAAGILEIGDIIRSLKGGPVGGAAITRAINALAPGERYSMRIARKGVERDVALVNEIVRRPVNVTSTACWLLVSLAFLLAAVVIGALKPDQRITQLAWGAPITEALSLLDGILIPHAEFLRGSAALMWQALQLVDGPHFAVGYHFYTRLFARNRRWGLPTILLFYIVGIAVPIVRLAVWHVPDPVTLESILIAEGAYYVLAPLAICATVLRNYLTVKEPDAHRRLRWVVFGSLAGILPYAAVKTFGVLGGTDLFFDRPYMLAMSLAILPAALIPISTGYAILKHRLFDINVVLRRGVQYLLARNMLRLVLSLPVAGLVYALITNAHGTVADLVLHNGLFIAAVVLIAAVLKYRERLGRWLDRRFFHESCRQEQVLMALIENVKQLNSAPEMCRHVGTQVTDALHPEATSVFYRSARERVFLCGFASDQRTAGIRVADASSLISMLQLRARPEDMTFIREKFGEAPACRWLDRMGVDLTVPIMQTDRSLGGFMLLGRKKSEEPYTPEDRALLAAVAEQMGIVCENLALQERLFGQQETARQMRAQAADAGAAWLQECPSCGRCFDLTETRCTEDSNELVSALAIPRLVEGRYRLDQVLGRGGMGVVYRAWDTRLKRDVAIKLLPPVKLADAAALKRFAREAHTLARVSHPNIVATYDFGVLEGELGWIVMEFVPGSTLRARISSGAIRASLAASWLGQFLDGVQAAHEAGIVHRDLKPENVLVSHPIDENSRVKIADFGIARWSATDATDLTLTVPGTLLGSIQYMSPEQLSGQAVDSRSDLFSAGVIIFEVLTGSLPFSGKSPAERIASILHHTRSFESVLPGAPGLHKVLDRCFAREPEQRHESAAALKADLIPALSGSMTASAS